MDDGDLDFSNPDTYLCPATGNADLPVESCSMGSYFDDIFQDDEHLACTHTHTCNPPVDDHTHTHTHTCIHVHTKIVPASSESPSESGAPSKKRPAGNRAAVRRYREKKKAHTALLEEEAAHLKALNKQLLKKLQNHAALKAEAARLRFLLVDFRGRIEGEIGAFPYRRPLKSNDLVPGVDPQAMSSCGFRCNDDQLYRNPGMQQQRSMGDGGGVMSGQVLGQGAAGDIANIRCTGSAKPAVMMSPVCGGLGTMPSGRLPNAEK